VYQREIVIVALCKEQTLLSPHHAGNLPQGYFRSQPEYCAAVDFESMEA
jgi:hypothetical protein